MIFDPIVKLRSDRLSSRLFVLRINSLNESFIVRCREADLVRYRLFTSLHVSSFQNFESVSSFLFHNYKFEKEGHKNENTYKRKVMRTFPQLHRGHMTNNKANICVCQFSYMFSYTAVSLN